MGSKGELLFCSMPDGWNALWVQSFDDLHNAKYFKDYLELSLAQQFLDNLHSLSFALFTKEQVEKIMRRFESYPGVLLGQWGGITELRIHEIPFTLPIR